MNCIASTRGRFVSRTRWAAAAAFLAMYVAPTAQARVVIDEVSIRAVSTITAPSGVTILRDVEERSSLVAFAGVGSEARYDRPAIGASNFPPVLTRGTQTMQGLNTVDLTAPGIGLFNQIESLESVTFWDARARNALLPPVTLPAAPAMEFTIFGGELAFGCYNCFLSPTSVSIAAYIYVFEPTGPTIPPPSWSYEATLASNGFDTPLLSVMSSDPQGIGAPAGTVTVSGPSFAFSLQPFTGSLTLPVLVPNADIRVLYRMSVRARGQISLEGDVRGSIGDPFSLGAGGTPALLLDGQRIDTLLAPVPEPNSYVVMLVGLSAVLIAARRKARRKAAYRDGTTHIVMQAKEFMQRLAALVPRPRLHLIRFHGVLAPHAKLRAAIIPQPAQKASEPTHEHADGNAARMHWAQLLRRVFDLDVERCECGGKLKIIAAIEEPAVIVRNFTHLGLPARAPPRSPARSAPLMQVA